MNRIDKMKHKIAAIEKLLAELKEELLIVEQELISSKKTKKSEDLPSLEIFKNEYEELYRSFVNENPKIVRDYVGSKTLKYLLKFCQINNIVIDSRKRSKSKIADEIIQWFVQRKAITKKI